MIMKIVVLNETSAADRNADILDALEGRSHTVINAGMTKGGLPPELTYIHTGLLTALFLNTGAADFVVGGCGTGQGYLNAAMQYPGVFCGHILTPLDAWLFTQINGGNCISLMLNQGYGWASNVNLKMIFDALFSVESGTGYPPHRQESQQESRRVLEKVSITSHRSMAEILLALPEDILRTALTFPGIIEKLEIDTLPDSALKKALNQWR
ncbi:MAG: RpiB/LacA/LacB family sugar-phosphate isomerase [Anaerolineaceae bacterium]|jgi:ribose 5-phosphate isomerase RpiB|nr:RpiB/LacA/LacB family sugar-phosphate isomerase [Anaerolineaceae bacterium]